MNNLNIKDIALTNKYLSKPIFGVFTKNNVSLGDLMPAVSVIVETGEGVLFINNLISASNLAEANLDNHRAPYGLPFNSVNGDDSLFNAALRIVNERLGLEGLTCKELFISKDLLNLREHYVYLVKARGFVDSSKVQHLDINTIINEYSGDFYNPNITHISLNTDVLTNNILTEYLKKRPECIPEYLSSDVKLK